MRSFSIGTRFNGILCIFALFQRDASRLEGVGVSNAEGFIGSESKKRLHAATHSMALGVGLWPWLNTPDGHVFLPENHCGSIRHRLV
ncbi:hypothetical protein [Fundidesulfovibrio agrisoli]|uniref:hypothetical protein n=1 Tax=Fundidesulfovibrio agrisoli TaxID=2922717 RepID=UPI001FAC7348|nr:hypothetical protein [Fundidesulfovibrio agrisoli]